MPVKVALPEEFWHLSVVALLFVIENDEPEPVVGMVTLPSQLPLPVPSRTCSFVVRTRPVRASTYTVRREASPCLRPVTQVSHASRECLVCSTTRRLLPRVARFSRCVLVARAAALETVALTERSLTWRVCATLVARILPLSSVDTTKSPPTTGMPR